MLTLSATVATGLFVVIAGVEPPCSVITTSANSAYASMGGMVAGWTQRGSDWSFRRAALGATPHAAAAGELLVGVGPFWGPFGAWGTPEFAFNVPLVGPVYSPDGALNQNPSYYVPPKFTGLMAHPGNTRVTSLVYTHAGACAVMSGGILRAEVLGGFFRNGVQVGAWLARSNGSSVALIASTVVLPRAAQDPFITLPFVGGARQVCPGDKVLLIVDDRGDASEDWLNAYFEITLLGAAPVIESISGMAEGGTVPVCVGSATELEVKAVGATTARWYKDGEALSDDGRIVGSATTRLMFIATAGSDLGEYVCVVRNACGSRISLTMRLESCLGEYNCDGGVDGADVDAFFVDWVNSDPRSDINADGGIDGADVQAFFDRWSAGC